MIPTEMWKLVDERTFELLRLAPCLPGRKHLEQGGRRRKVRFEKKRLMALLQKKKIRRVGSLLFVESDDPNDFSAVRCFLRLYNREQKKKFRCLSEEEQKTRRAEAIKFMFAASIGLGAGVAFSLFRSASVAGLSLPG